MSYSSPLTARSSWRKAHHISHGIDSQYTEWLLDKGSLTQKLIDKSHGKFTIQVLDQSIKAVPFSEKKALAIPHRQWAVIREVILYGNDDPWVYARTVIPLSTLRGPLRRLHFLGNQSLGGQLFSNPTMRREPVEVALLAPDYFSQTSLHKARKKIHNMTLVWGRRSVFRVFNKPLLVSEMFLPDLFRRK